MFLVGISAVVMALVGPSDNHLSSMVFPSFQAVKYRSLERQERLREDRERKISTDRAAIRSELMKKRRDFAAMSPDEQETLIFAEVFFHRVQSKRARLEAGEAGRDPSPERGRCPPVLEPVRNEPTLRIAEYNHFLVDATLVVCPS